MATQLAYPDLVKAMVGKDTLSGWDVLVTYDENKVNDLLKARAQTFSGVTNMDPFSANIQIPGVPFPIETTFNLTFTDPLLQFSGAQGLVEVSFAMGGTSSTTYNGQVTAAPLPDGLRLVCTTALVNVAGYTPDNSTTFVPDPSKPIAGANHIVILDPGATELHNICIDFSKPNCKVVNASGPASSNDMLAAYNSLLLSDIEQHFSEAGGLKYYLAGISNVYNPSDVTSDVLRPTRFCFTSVLGDSTKNIPGALSIWIAVQGGNGNNTSGATEVSFAPDSVDVHPLPLDSSASVIFSHDLIANQCFKPGFSSLTNFQIKSTKGTPGMVFTAQFPVANESHIIVDAQDSWAPGDPLHDLYEWIMDGVDCAMNSGTLTFTLSTTIPSTASLNWTSYEQALHWKVLFGVAHVLDSQGTTRVTFQFNGGASWKAPLAISSSESPNLISLGPFTHDECFSTVIAQDSVDTWQNIRNKTSLVDPPSFTGTKIVVPPIGLSMKPMDYFLTTNLLFPGTHMFVADPPTRLATPRDMILTGNVGQVLQAPASLQQATNALAKTYLNSSLAVAIPLAGLLGAAEAPTGVDFVKGMVQSNSMLSDLFTALSMDDPVASGAKIVSILNENGYGSISGDDLAQVYGYNWDTMTKLYVVTPSVSTVPKATATATALQKSRPFFDLSPSTRASKDRKGLPGCTAAMNGLPVSPLPTKIGLPVNPIPTNGLPVNPFPNGLTVNPFPTNGLPINPLPLPVNLTTNDSFSKPHQHAHHELKGLEGLLPAMFNGWCPSCCPCSCHSHSNVPAGSQVPEPDKPAGEKDSVPAAAQPLPSKTKPKMRPAQNVIPSAGGTKPLLRATATAGSKGTPVDTTDLALFTASYLVSEPASEVGNVLTMLPDVIDYVAIQTQPITHVDPVNHTLRAQWSTGDTSKIYYDIIFSAAITKGSPVVPQFNGTLTVDSNAPQNFTGQWQMPDTGSSGDVFPGYDDTKISIASALVGLGLGIPTLLSIIIPFVWRWKDKKASSAAADKLLNDMTTKGMDVINGVKEIHKNRDIAEGTRLVRQAIVNKDLSWAEFEGQIDTIRNNVITDLQITNAEMYELANEISGVAGGNPLTAQRKAEIYDAFTKAITDGATAYAVDAMSGQLADHFQLAMDAKLFDPKDLNEVITQAVLPESTGLVTKLDDATGGQPGDYAKAIAQDVFLTQAKIARQTDGTALTLKLKSIANDLQDATTERDNLQQQEADCADKIEAENEKQKNDPDNFNPDPLNALLKQQEQIKADLETAQKKADALEQAQRDNLAKADANEAAKNSIDTAHDGVKNDLAPADRVFGGE